MSLILAVDTTSEHGSLALLRDGELLEERLLHAPGSFSPVLYEELQHLLERHAVKLADVACFAAASGPGRSSAPPRRRSTGPMKFSTPKR